MKAFIITMLAIISLVLGISAAYGAEFTIDERSLYHVVASAAISSTCGLVMFNSAPENYKNRRWFCFGSALMVGAFKEFAIDGYVDYGDLAFDAIGSLSVIATDSWQLRAYRKGEANGVEITVNY